MSNPFISLIQQYLPEPMASLLSGMLFGVKQGFSSQFYQALITTGTIHVVALSGMNITIIINIISKITYPLGRKISSIVSLIGIIGFILFVGPSPTIIRAGIMGSLSLIGIYLGKQYYGLLGLIMAGLIMLILDHSVITDISFQLSFLATFGILLFAPKPIKTVPVKVGLGKAVLYEIKNSLIENLRTTLAAQVATLPIIVFAFGRVSLVSPLTNILVGSTIFPITLLGLITVLTGIIIFPLGQVFAWFCYILLYYFVWVVELTSKLPFASLNLNE